MTLENVPENGIRCRTALGVATPFISKDWLHNPRQIGEPGEGSLWHGRGWNNDAQACLNSLLHSFRSHYRQVEGKKAVDHSTLKNPQKEILAHALLSSQSSKRPIMFLSTPLLGKQPFSPRLHTFPGLKGGVGVPVLTKTAQ